MITVRSPAGFSIQYNDAHYAVRRTEYTDLYKEAGQKDWVAQVPNSWVVEIVRPCRMYDAANNPQDLAEEFLKALREQRVGGYKLADIKKELRNFDALRRRWK